MSLSFDSPLVAAVLGMPAVLLLLKLTGVLATALAVSGLMRRTSASARHLVWLVALVAALGLPLWSAWAPVPVRVLPAAPAPTVVESATPPATQAPVAPSVAPMTLSSVAAQAPARRSIDLGTWLLGLWAFGVVVLLARLVLGAWVIRGIVRRARVLDEPDWQRPIYEISDRLDLRDAPRLVQSDRIKMPFATGFVKAVIVLPAESGSWSEERRYAVLIHELAHVKRRDLVGHLVGAFACALYWFHPLMWTAARQLRAESERACDDLALVLGTPATDYAEHLLEIVTEVHEDRMPAVALAMAKPTEFEGRMLAILDPRRYRHAPSRVQTAWLVGSLTVLALAVGAVSPARRLTASPAAADAAAKSTAAIVEHEVTPMTLAAAAPKEKTTQKTQTKTQTKQTTQTYESDKDDADTDIEVSKDSKSAQKAEVLAKTLRTDSDAEVRRVAAWGLSRYASNDAAAKALADAVIREPNASVREMATWALADSRSPVARSALETAFLHDKSPEVRRTAAWAAGNIGSKSSVEGLSKLLTDPDPNVREVAAWAIGNCSPEKAPPGLTRLLNDANSDVRQSAAWALYEIGDESTADELEAAFHREKDPEVQRGLIRAMGAMGEQSVETLTRLVNSSDPEIRAIAVAALAGGNISGPWPWPRPEPRPYP